MDLYTQTSIECSKLITKRYSTSFSLGISLLGASLRPHVYSIYAFVRLADEIVDTYGAQNPEAELILLKEATYRAINQGLSFNPVLHAFQHTVQLFDIDLAYIDAFFQSMEMDLQPMVYTPELYRQYIYGSAEVVGLMCLQVFCGSDKRLYQSLIEPARALGSAFQKVNFLRDFKSDLDDRSRIYFPHITRENLATHKTSIEAEIENEFTQAQLGVNQLPLSSRRGVQLALSYYRCLLYKISQCDPQILLEKRIRISNFQKLRLLMAQVLQPGVLVAKNA